MKHYKINNYNGVLSSTFIDKYKDKDIIRKRIVYNELNSNGTPNLNILCKKCIFIYELGCPYMKEKYRFGGNSLSCFKSCIDKSGLIIQYFNYIVNNISIYNKLEIL